MRPLDPAAGPVERFACELRALRAAAGDLPFWKMARRCGVSKSTLADAVAGRRLPSERVVEAFVGVCDGDWSWWRLRWQQVAEGLADSTQPQASELAVSGRGVLVPVSAWWPERRNGTRPVLHLDGSDDPHSQRERQTRIRSRSLPALATWMVLAVLTASAATLTGLYLSGELGRAAGNAPRPAPLKQPHHLSDGSNPDDAGCRAASVEIDHAPVVLQGPVQLRGHTLPTGSTIGTVTLVYARGCASAWPRFDPSPILNPSLGNAVSGRIALEADRPADVAQSLVSWQTGQFSPAIGDLLLTGPGCVTAHASITLTGQSEPATGNTRCLPLPNNPQHAIPTIPAR